MRFPTLSKLAPKTRSLYPPIGVENMKEKCIKLNFPLSNAKTVVKYFEQQLPAAK